MHHMYPLAKGDPLCPLGFHPQVRWPTRCKRCFREYKEHGGRRREEDASLRRDDTTASTPSLSWSSREKDGEKGRSWVSSTNLAYENSRPESNHNSSALAVANHNPSSWTSTPDLANLEDDTQPVTTVSIKLPKRKQKPIDTGQRPASDSFSVVKSDKASVFHKNDSLATRAKKLQAMKEASQDNKAKRIQIKEVKTISEEPTNHDVKTKTKTRAEEEQDDDTLSIAGTETTDTTLVDPEDHELKDQLESMRKELETTKTKCDRLEREKSDILLRRLAAMETTTSKTTATEVLKLQHKCNELQEQLEDFRDEKKSLSLRVRELEEDLEQRPTAQAAQKVADELRSKLLAAESLCEELMDENEDIKKEMRDMEEQMDEMQDNFREEQAVEYTSLKKELDQTTKNCRILSFKLKKSERKVEQVEQEKAVAEKKLKEISGGQSALASLEKLKQMEQDLKLANEVSLRLQKELDSAQQKLEETAKIPKKKTPTLASIGKFPSADTKVSRESLTRGGSQDDPVQLLRDLQDSMEREADLREQLKFAEEEGQNLRKKVSRIEDDNESLVMQLKKMATRARSRKLSPTNNIRLTPEPPTEKGDVSDDEDPAEIKLHLELSEQEASVLRRKVEELEGDNHRIKAKNKELQEKLITKSTTKRTLLSNDKGTTLQNQKLKILEDESNDLRKKLIEKERDCERLHAELSLNQKRDKRVPKSKSLDLDQQTLDLKRQLQVIEQEASILRTKIQSLESENEKLISENKRLQLLRETKNLKADKNIDKYVDQIATLEVEIGEKNDKIKELEKNAKDVPALNIKNSKIKQFIERNPKKVSALTSKDQLKTMVSDLENEINEVIVAIKTRENERVKLEEELQKLKSESIGSDKIKEIEELNNQITKELELEKENLKQEKLKFDELNKTVITTKESLNKANSEKKKWKSQTEKLKEDVKKLEEEKSTLEQDIEKLRTSLKTATYKLDESTLLTQKYETLKLNSESKDKEMKALNKEIDEKTRTMNELNDKYTKLANLESKLAETEEKLKKAEKSEKEKVKELEAKIEEERSKNKAKEGEQSSLNSKWNEERKKLNSKIQELTDKILSLETTIESKKKQIERLEENLRKEKENVSKTNLKVGDLENRQIKELKDELTASKTRLGEIETKLEASEKSKKTLEEKLKKSEMDSKSSALSLEKKTVELEIEIQNEKKKVELLKTNHEKENKNKELELTSLKSKIKTLELNSAVGTKRLSEIKQFQESIDKLESSLSKEKQKYEDLTSKYEILEEEHVVTKAKLVMEKETIANQLTTTKSELKELETELRTLRETYNRNHDTWIKEKLDMQEKLKEFDKTNGHELEKTRLRASLVEKQSEFEQLKKEYSVINDQMEYMRKDGDDLRRKLDDYEKVNKVQRNISADSSAMENEIRQLKAKLASTEKSKKLDLSEYKLRYDNQISIVNGELQQLQGQVLRFKRERDTYKHMLESAQKTIGDLKHNPSRDPNKTPLHYDELDEAKSQVATLEQQISCMEDELSEARLEASRLKTELVSERSSWEVKLSELHSRVNELEEEKILSSGRTKIVGLRTRMELAWQKEREEQQRLLQETATLARDLRQTLFEVERERDKERLEAKRKQDQVKKSSEEDQDENKKKITELQCDLLELRDAHAKLRTTNEKLRREKERYEKEREEYKLVINGKKRVGQGEDRRIATIIEQIDYLKQLAPELFFSREREGCTPTPPRRLRGSKSRETSPALKEDKQQEIQALMLRLVAAAEDIRQRGAEEEYELRRSLTMRRATSTEHENSPARYAKRRGPDGASLHRKSISLEQTTMPSEQKIWTNDDSMSSLQSLEMSSDVERWTNRDASMDSRLSGGSTQSEFMGEKKKKKKGLMGKLKKLTKSRSIDDQDPGTFPPSRTLSSKPNSSTEVSEEKGSKKDLRDRITGMFKKSGSASRSSSVERHDTSSTQRPLMRNGSSGNMSSRASPSLSETERTTTKGKTKRT